jgi:polysaccharide pyruvyl transferase WcaK-like protein
MRIVIFNVKFSANLGDGLLSECLEAELKDFDTVAEVSVVDLAARTGYGTVARRRLLLSALEMLPDRLRRMTAGIFLRRLVRKKLMPICMEALDRADVAILGGGNLLSDADLNFPIKVNGALAAVRHAGIPFAVFGVGVSDNWSERAQRLFGSALSQVNLVHAAVRDRRSQNIWDRNLSAYRVGPAQIGSDPGLLTARHFPESGARKPGHIGLCFTDPLALRYHGGPNAGHALEEWMLSITRELAARGHSISLFTNGSPEDISFLLKMEPRLTDISNGAATVVPPFSGPAALAGFISTCGLVIAHRMHACIAAYSYAIPSIGLRWDPKLDSFFESVDRSDYMVEPATLAPSQLADLAERALSEGVDYARHVDVVEAARADVRALYLDLLQSAGR